MMRPRTRGSGATDICLQASFASEGIFKKIVNMTNCGEFISNSFLAARSACPGTHSIIQTSPGSSVVGELISTSAACSLIGMGTAGDKIIFVRCKEEGFL